MIGAIVLSAVLLSAHIVDTEQYEHVVMIRVTDNPATSQPEPIFINHGSTVKGAAIGRNVWTIPGQDFVMAKIPRYKPEGYAIIWRGECCYPRGTDYMILLLEEPEAAQKRRAVRSK